MPEEMPNNHKVLKRWRNAKGQLHREDGPAIEYINGDKYWYVEGKLHRTDGPAIEDVNGDKYWYVEGKLHRTDGPAIEYANGDKAWYKEDKLHRTDGPAVEHADGTKYWYVEGKLHRTDGPAIEYADRYNAWYVDGKLHRTDGPAIEYADGSKCWYVEGAEYSEEEFKNKMCSTPRVDEGGTKRWYNAEGQPHRTDGPAIEYANGYKVWYKEGKLHRTDGPAAGRANGIKHWHIEGRELSEEEFNTLTTPVDKSKKSLKIISDTFKQGSKVGIATEAANLIQGSINDLLTSTFGVTKEKLQNPINKEIAMLVSIAMTHLGAELYQDKVNKEKIQNICELILEGKVKDNTGLLLKGLPALLSMSHKMDTQKKHISTLTSDEKTNEAILNKNELNELEQLEHLESFEMVL